jgi:25S rRNA (uracil2634-N3)-methyltransferase
VCISVLDEERRTPQSMEQSLLVHEATLDCAVRRRCVPCLYKLFPQGREGLPPNQRPEQCPRSCTSGAGGEYRGLYSHGVRVLTVGDGDFSFSLSLARGNKTNYKEEKKGFSLVATSHESKESVLETYKWSAAILEELRTLGATVLHSIDATCLSKESALDGQLFDFVLWNFPCICASYSRAADGQTQELEANKELLRKFFCTVQGVLSPGGQVHVTHKSIEPFSWWGIEQLGKEAGLEFCGSVVFDRCLYPGYVNRKVKDSKSFPLHDARVFVFNLSGTDGGGSNLLQKELIPLSDEGVAAKLAKTIASFQHAEGKPLISQGQKRKR